MSAPSVDPHFSLPPVPTTVEDAHGRPRFGTYRGAFTRIDFSGLQSPYALPLPLRVLKHKRWLYSFIATREVVAAFAVVDVGYTANAFATVVDLRDRRVLVDESYLGLPLSASVNDSPGEGLSVGFRTPVARFSARRGAGAERYQLAVELKRVLPIPGSKLSLRGELLAEGGAPALTVVAPVSNGGVVNVTQKWAAMTAFGSLETGGRRYELDGGVGGLDYTQGLLARRTAWRWAFANGRLADGSALGLNLVEGFNDDVAEANENALWVGQRLIPLGRAKFEFNRDEPLDAWRVTTVDGAVDLRFRPIGVHRDERDLKLVKSHFVQPFGLFEGAVRVGDVVHPIKDLPGVTEDQDILW
jgi:hypothetical protein